ncbi:MAG: deoxyribodipyrimidine photo-lyase [Deltaproteobacteria bacterium]|nr:deoxyribodipyrimidine photo-lyase [Deltaproteobacteria bacterium]
MSTAIVWFHRDLRLADHPALHRAAKEHTHVVPVYVSAPHEEAPWAPGAASRWWLHWSLVALDESLIARGSRLIVRAGDSLTVLRALVRDTGASAVYWNRRYEPAIVARDRMIEEALCVDGTQVNHCASTLLVEPSTLCKADGTPYQVFTPFWRAIRRREPPRAPLAAPKLRGPSRWPEHQPVDTLRLRPRVRWDVGLENAWQPGEARAHARLQRFCENGLADYPHGRDFPGLDGISRLSPHLHFGELSPSQIWHAVGAATSRGAASEDAAESYLRQLGWREFAHYTLHHWPHTPVAPLQAKFSRYPWRQDYGELLRDWQRGRTGYPMVDAGMRELWTTGWMHNRARMLTASFLVKNCRIPWLEGARWFWDTLVDANLANNTLGWQWTAGCGTDAAPYFRIFSPVRQGEQFDGDGAYVRRWVPELAPIPNRALHKPWGSAASSKTNYPAPRVDFAASRTEALAGWQEIRAADQTTAEND